MRRSLRSFAAAGAAVAGMVFGMTACGGDGGDVLSQARHGGADPCVPTPGVDRNKISLGMLYSGSRYDGDPSALFRAGVDARLGEQNAKGGIYGRQLSYSIEDDEATPELNAVAGRALVQRDEALGILQFSVAASGSAKLLENSGVPVVDGQITDPSVTPRSNVFSYSRPTVEEPASSGWGEFLAGRDAQRAVTVSIELSSATQSMAHAAGKSVLAAGLEVAGNLQVPSGPFDADRFADQVRDSGADSLIAFVPAPNFYQIVAAVQDADLDLKAILGNPTSYDRSQLARVGDKAAGAYAFLDYTPFELNTPTHRRFLAAMAAYAPQAAALPDGTALIGWISADLMVRGIAAAGVCPTRAGVLAGLHRQTRFDADGLLPAPINLSKGVSDIAPCYDYVQVTQDGKKFAPVPGKPRCGRILRAR
ncbi:ABC transporter substrate-binding protein [Frankia sp. QA3]|uniref:ABC transporter substrate-binding protein n=1 Tax=Frankia sp. QA3 TaxID=710111 RepID=UPI000269CDE1|nr:ABC transporter substrate-binding protein [Frankia sp. QA3]EIV96145.1 ABC-type branched-chain amino acid transport system, periplasmic component [Frankia sp. QA3]